MTGPDREHSGRRRDTAVGTSRRTTRGHCTRDLHSGGEIQRRDGESQWSSLCVPPPLRLCANFLKVRLGMTGPDREHSGDYTGTQQWGRATGLHGDIAHGRRNSTQRRGDGESQWSSLCVPAPLRLCANFSKVRFGMTGPEGDGVSLGLETRGTKPEHSRGDEPPDYTGTLHSGGEIQRRDAETGSRSVFSLRPSAIASLR